MGDFYQIRDQMSNSCLKLEWVCLNHKNSNTASSDFYCLN